VIGGVMPPDFRFPLLRQAEMLVPAAFEPIELQRRDHSWMTVVGRLKTGFGVREAQADLDRLAPRLAEQLEEHSGWRQEARPLLDDLVGPLKPALIALQGAVLLVLLIACANVASMLLARGMARQRELAIRAELGGGRRALVVAEMALALVLAAGAGLMIRSLAVLLDVRTGLASPERVLVADLDLPEAQYGNDRVAAFAQQLLQRVSGVPGARSSALLTNI